MIEKLPEYVRQGLNDVVWFNRKKINELVDFCNNLTPQKIHICDSNMGCNNPEHPQVEAYKYIHRVGTRNYKTSNKVDMKCTAKRSLKRIIDNHTGEPYTFKCGKEMEKVGEIPQNAELGFGLSFQSKVLYQRPQCKPIKLT